MKDRLDRAARLQLIGRMFAGQSWQTAVAESQLHISRSTAYRLVQYARDEEKATMPFLDDRHGHPYKQGFSQIAWYESVWKQEREEEPPFTPGVVSTPTLTDYRSYLQQTLRLKPASVNRALISLKRYFAWLVTTGQIKHDPAKVVKLVGEEASAPRQLDDQKEQAFVAAVTATGSPRDCAIIVLMLHTGLRARELCTLTRAQVKLGKRSGTIAVHGKHNKYREIPLNTTARAALEAYDPSLRTSSHDAAPLFLSQKKRSQLTERGLGYVIKKYAIRANVHDLSPHDLRHRFGYRMAASVPLHRLAQLMGHDSLGTTMLYIRGTKQDLQHDVEKIAWR